jgi:ribosomal protein S12 methylthiotransferase accessory factor
MVSVFNGAGVSREEAFAAAVMEAVERFAAAQRPSDVIRGTFNEIQRDGPTLDPSGLWDSMEGDRARDAMLEWIAAQSLVTGRTVMVPLSLVSVPYRPKDKSVRIGPGTSTGLASGTNVLSATISGLREITSDIGVPTYEAVLSGCDVRLRQLRSVGQASRPRSTEAIKKALVEAEQGRVVAMVGLREDLVRRRLLFRQDMEDWVKATYQETAFAPDIDFSEGQELCRKLVESVTEVTMNDVLLVDLSRNDLPVSVVRALTPGLASSIRTTRPAD